MSGVQAYHLGQAPRVYSFDRKTYDRAVRARQYAPETKQAAPLGLGGAFGGAPHVSSGIPAFNSFFPTPYQTIQGNIALTPGSTLLDTGGTGPVLTFTGALTGPPVPIWVKAVTGGAFGVWQYAVYYDGVGTTAAMSGTSTGTVSLTGAGAGLTLNIAAGTATINNIWKATASGWSDTSGNANHHAQATSSRQPIIGIGLGGMCSAIFQSARLTYLNANLVMGTPSTNPRSVYLVFRWTGTTAGQSEVIGGTGGSVIFSASGNPTGVNDVAMYNGSISNAIATPRVLNQWYRAFMNLTASTNDRLRVGAAQATGGNANNGVTSNVQLASDAGGGGFFGNVEILLLSWFPGTITSFPTADAAVAALSPGTVEF